MAQVAPTSPTVQNVGYPHRSFVPDPKERALANTSFLLHSATHHEVLRAELLRLCRLQRRIPATVRYTIANALVVTDALGESLTIPWSLVSSYDVSPTFYLVYLVLTIMLPPSPYLPKSQDLHKSLIKHFRGKVGEQRVLDEKY
jgi:hypothetical protein